MMSQCNAFLNRDINIIVFQIKPKASLKGLVSCTCTKYFMCSQGHAEGNEKIFPSL